MNTKIFLLCFCCVIATIAEGRSHEKAHVKERAQPKTITHSQPSSKQARVFPGAVAIKKLVLLKFKKIIPISLILLRSSNENEAELVPVYPTGDIPDNVKFIATPNGISGHRDVQAIAIPSELHEQLEQQGLADVDKVEALLQQGDVVQPQLAVSTQQINANSVAETELLEDDDNAEVPAQANQRGLKSFRARTTLDEIPLIIYSKSTLQYVPKARNFY